MERRADGWRLISGPTTDEQALEVDAVVLAIPAAPAARLLAAAAPDAAAALREVRYASVAIVTLVLDRQVAGLDGSGLLVPPVEGRYVKAMTFSSTKWQWLDEACPGRVVLRASVGRSGEEHDLQLDDAEITRRALADLRSVPGVRLPEPAASAVSRWGGGLPQYGVGHLALVERVTRAVHELPGLAVAGAAYEGVGVPACVASGRRAAVRVLTRLRAGAGGERQSLHE
jgi:oxygen-dependent protoporphyrinogen oxidase